MTKSEFLNTLRTQLQGELSQAQIEGHLHYYNEYISEAVASGRRESDVLDELGSPVFIAKTLLDAADRGEEEQQETDGYHTFGYGQQEDEDEEYYGGKIHTWNVHPLVLRIGIPVLVITVLMLVFSVIGSMFMLVARFFVPILLIILVINIFRNH